MPILEICASSFQSAINAEQGGAHRVELCQNLEAGGTTPSYGLIAKVKQSIKIPVNVLIRPRTGDFVYDDNELDIMLQDIETCCVLGCDGVVVGVLTRDACIDVQRLVRLVHAAKPMPVTFHRAFDDCHDQRQALEDIIAAGCVRVLTSGGRDNALDGSNAIAELVKAARDRIVIMPGAGITSSNLSSLVHTTAATEYHASAKIVLESPSKSRFDAVQLQTDANQVKALVDILDDFSSTIA